MGNSRLAKLLADIHLNVKQKGELDRKALFPDCLLQPNTVEIKQSLITRLQGCLIGYAVGVARQAAVS